MNPRKHALGKKGWGIMRCFVILVVGLVTALVFASDAWARPPSAPGSPPAAYHQSCLPDGTVRVTFGWTPSYAGSQWLDLSLADNGFASGTFVSVWPLALSTGLFTWDGIAPGRLHFARVNAYSINRGWEPGPTSRFVTRTCSTSSAAHLASVSPEQCDAMTFQWAPANPEGLVQWIDLSTTNNGFAPGTYAQAGPLSGGASGFHWTRLRQGTRHYWRVNTWTGSRWISSATGSFSTPPPQLAATADAERILGAAARAMKGRDIPVFVTQATPAPYNRWVEEAIALGGKAFYGTYDGCVNQVIVVEAPGGDGSVTLLVEPMAELPATWRQAHTQLKQLFPGAGRTFDGQWGGGGPDTPGTLYLFQDIGDPSYGVIASSNNGIVVAAAFVGSGSYKHLAPNCC